jgi:hypothetical protein
MDSAHMDSLPDRYMKNGETEIQLHSKDMALDSLLMPSQEKHSLLKVGKKVILLSLKLRQRKEVRLYLEDMLN